MRIRTNTSGGYMSSITCSCFVKGSDKTPIPASSPLLLIFSEICGRAIFLPSAGTTEERFDSFRDRDNCLKPLIEWLVPDRSLPEALLITRYAIEFMPYHTGDAKVTRENCDLRKWLNGFFLSCAFTPEERKFIKLSRLANEDISYIASRKGEWMNSRRM